MINRLYYSDNLHVLRENVATESVDLIYLDPPFNSNASYNVLFKNSSGKVSDAQIEAFKDTWHWGEEAESAFSEVLGSTNTQAAELLRALRLFLGENDMMAYLAMMTVRLLELHRVLKSTGSLYLHCDPTASHYLKVMLDAVFGPEHFLNEITWKRTSAHHTARRYGNVADIIFFYGKTDKYIWNPQYTGFSAEQLNRYKPDQDGRLYKGENLTADRSNSISGKFEWRGTMPPSSRGWGYSIDQLEKWWEEGRILTRKDGSPRMDGLKVYLDGLPGQTLQSVWTDIERIGNTSKERLGYPTQKPLGLLERILLSSSNEGSVVLDPFCGCGTAVHAAQKLGRQWIGIDITHLAISLIERRLKDAFQGIVFDVHGTPKDLESALDLARRDKYQFQWWAVSLVDARPYGGKKKGADGGIDGILFFRSDKDKTEKALISVKGGENVGVGMVRDLIAVVSREKAAVGVLISLAFPTRAMESEAAAAGFFETPFEKVPKIQIITLAGLFQGQRPRIPRIDSSATFKTAARERGDAQGSLI